MGVVSRACVRLTVSTYVFRSSHRASRPQDPGGAAVSGKLRSISVPSSSSSQTHRPTRTDRAALDRLLELVGRRRLSAAELRILLQLVDREAGIPELAEALDQRPIDVRRCGRRLSARGLVSWRHAGPLKHTQLTITPAGVATVRALLTAAGGVVDAATTPDMPTAPS
jgi:hypothetical protein